MPLDVIGAGFGRTGTSSLKSALEELGFGPCYHMTEVFAHPEHVPTWEAAEAGRPHEWEEVFRNYRAAVDWPAAFFYQQLMERYPDAPVILTLRDPERWYESALNTIYAISKLTTSPPISWILALLSPRHYRITAMTSRVAWDELFDGRFEDRQHAIAIFNRYNADVQRHVPADRLLVYDVKQGWEPLCAFLNVPVPNNPFPRLNDTAEFRKNIRRIQAVAYGLPIALTALVVGTAVVLARRSR